tara:strand:+ start:1762 stop:1923 length:162 start_codon:yes stop_codon:yes gene_type:complete
VSLPSIPILVFIGYCETKETPPIDLHFISVKAHRSKVLNTIDFKKNKINEVRF